MFFKCSITRHTNKQGNTPQSKPQNKSLETNLKETQTSELLDKDFKTTVLNRLNKNKGKQRDLRKPEKQYMNKIRVLKKSIKKREQKKIKINKI